MSSLRPVYVLLSAVGAMLVAVATDGSCAEPEARTTPTALDDAEHLLATARGGKLTEVEAARAAALP